MTMAMMKTESPLARQTEAASCSQSQCGLLETEFFSYCASVLKQMCPKTRWDARDFFVCVFTNSHVWGLVSKAAAEPSFGSRAFETNC